MQCYASGEVRCGIVLSVVISICVIELFVILILLVVILSFISLVSRSHFSHMFSLYSHGILGVVFTVHLGHVATAYHLNERGVGRPALTMRHVTRRNYSSHVAMYIRWPCKVNNFWIWMLLSPWFVICATLLRSRLIASAKDTRRHR